MVIQPILDKITIYPVKSLDGIALQKGMITEGGCLLHDREYAITDTDGNFITGKRNPLVHSLRSTVDFEHDIISFRRQEETKWNHFHLHKEKSAIESYLTEYFGIATIFSQSRTGRFMDIPDISGVTVVSTASLKTVSQWFDSLKLTETRKRFRATIEIKGVPAFWEDHLFYKEDTRIEFTIGTVTLFGMSPRARCIVPTRNPETGRVVKGFQKSFAQQRSAALPEWSTLSEYGHYYHLSVDCYIPPTEVGKWIELGDEVTIIGKKRFSIMETI